MKGKIYKMERILKFTMEHLATMLGLKVGDKIIVTNAYGFGSDWDFWVACDLTLVREFQGMEYYEDLTFLIGKEFRLRTSYPALSDFEREILKNLDNKCQSLVRLSSGNLYTIANTLVTHMPPEEIVTGGLVALPFKHLFTFVKENEVAIYIPSLLESENIFQETAPTAMEGKGTNEIFPE